MKALKEYAEPIRELFESSIPSCVRLVDLRYFDHWPGQAAMSVYLFDLHHEDGRLFTVNFGVDQRELLGKSPEYVVNLLWGRTLAAAMQVAEGVGEPEFVEPVEVTS